MMVVAATAMANMMRNGDNDAMMDSWMGAVDAGSVANHAQMITKNCKTGK